MTCVVVKFNGKSGPAGPEYSFSVQSGIGNLPSVLDANLPDQPNDPPFRALSQLNSDPNTDTTAVTDAGAQLLAALNKHPNAALAMTQTLNAPAGSQDREIRLHMPEFIDSPRQLPWEVLYDVNVGFFDADNGVPILRMIDPKLTATRPSGNLADDGLHFVSVLAADQIDGLSEYLALRASLAAYSKPWKLRVYSPDQSVIDHIANEGLSSVEHKHVPATAAELMTEISAFRPQICHFFCHGIAIGGGTASLEVANVLTTMGRTTVEIKPFELASALPSSAWLVLLNACSSGQAAGESSSLAARLVENGVPVVVGMREATKTQTLNVFTQGFLANALAHIDALLDQNGTTELQLGQSLTAARNSICTAFRRPGADAAKRVKDWSLPVMMVSTNEFIIRPKTTADPFALAQLVGQRDTLQDLLGRLGNTLSQQQKDQVMVELTVLSAQIQSAT